jgi:hypothetical protein
MFQKIIQLKSVITGKSYVRAPEECRAGCHGCAFDNETAMCLAAPDDCGDEQIIWKEVE